MFKKSIRKPRVYKETKEGVVRLGGYRQNSETETLRSALVEFYQHTGENDILDNGSSDCMPACLAVAIEKRP